MTAQQLYDAYARAFGNPVPFASLTEHRRYRWELIAKQYADNVTRMTSGHALYRAYWFDCDPLGWLDLDDLQRRRWNAAGRALTAASEVAA